MRKRKVIEAPVPVPTVDQDLIAELTKLQRRAIRGEIQGVAYAAIKSGRMGHYEAVSTGWSGSGCHYNIHTVCGAIDHLKARFIHANFDGVP